MPTPSSHPAAISFNGELLGLVTSFRVNPGAASYYEVTHIGSEVIGSGANSRVVRQHNCYAIDPGTVEVSMYGCPPYAPGDIGMRALLYVSFDGGSLTRYAYLDNFELTGNVGQFLTGRATFKYTGEEGEE